MMEVWIGLVHVKPSLGCNLLNGATGAFVSVVAIAEDGENFSRSVAAYLEEYLLDTVEFEDVELLQEREQSETVDEELVQLAQELTPDAPVGLGTFDVYLAP